jgi:hypothetical protein
MVSNLPVYLTFILLTNSQTSKILFSDNSIYDPS